MQSIQKVNVQYRPYISENAMYIQKGRVILTIQCVGAM